jgi:hypothetical protein
MPKVDIYTFDQECVHKFQHYIRHWCVPFHKKQSNQPYFRSLVFFLNNILLVLHLFNMFVIILFQRILRASQPFSYKHARPMFEVVHGQIWTNQGLSNFEWNRLTCWNYKWALNGTQKRFKAMKIFYKVSDERWELLKRPSILQLHKMMKQLLFKGGLCYTWRFLKCSWSRWSTIGYA